MRTVITHGHIFKNAGSTLDWTLKRLFSDSFCDHRDDIPMRRGGAIYLAGFLNDNSHIQAISSHHMCDSREIPDINIIPINLLRHPIERVRSVYNFEKRQQSDSPGAVAAKKYNFKDYVLWRMEPNVNRTIKNYQSFYLASRHMAAPHLKVDEQILSEALDYLASVFCVGVVDRYDESMVVFEEYIKTWVPEVDFSYIRQNSSETDVMSLSEGVQSVISDLAENASLLMEENAGDLSLYQKVNISLDKKVKEIKGFEEKLINFKERCSNLK